MAEDEKRSGAEPGREEARRLRSDENFLRDVEKARFWTQEQRIFAGKNLFAGIVERFHSLWDESPSAFVEPLMDFLSNATRLACRSQKGSPEKRREVAEYFQDLEILKTIMLAREDFYDFAALTDEGYQLLVNTFLCATSEPLAPAGEKYLSLLFSYMLLVACSADSVDEAGICAVQKLRRDYFDYLAERKAGSEEPFRGAPQRD